MQSTKIAVQAPVVFGSMTNHMRHRQDQISCLPKRRLPCQGQPNTEAVPLLDPCKATFAQELRNQNNRRYQISGSGKAVCSEATRRLVVVCRKKSSGQSELFRRPSGCEQMPDSSSSHKLQRMLVVKIRRTSPRRSEVFSGFPAHSQGSICRIRSTSWRASATRLSAANKASCEDISCNAHLAISASIFGVRRPYRFKARATSCVRYADGGYSKTETEPTGCSSPSLRSGRLGNRQRNREVAARATAGVPGAVRGDCVVVQRLA
jgi:hypothetical protein